MKPIIKIESTKPIPGIRQLEWRKESKYCISMWKIGTNLHKYGQFHYQVKLNDGYLLKWHIEKWKAKRVEPRRVHFHLAIEEEETKSSDENDQYYLSRKSLQQGTDSLTPIVEGP